MSEIPPQSQLLLAAIKASGWTQKLAAKVAGIDPVALHRILQGKKSLDATTALQMQYALGVSASKLLDIQKKHDLEVAKQQFSQADEIKKNRALFESVPVLEMIKRNWLPGVSDLSDLSLIEKQVLHYYNVQAISQIRNLSFAAKKTDELSEFSSKQLAWYARSKQIANSIAIPHPFQKDLFSSLIFELRLLLGKASAVREVSSLLASYGIRLIYVETLKGSKIDGGCFWISEKSPVISLSLRFDRIDNFWFVLRHELEHVIHGDGKSNLFIDCLDEVMKSEQQADEAYASFIDPEDLIGKTLSIQKNLFSKKSLYLLSEKLNIHPGLVAGRVHHITQNYGLFRKELVGIREFLLENPENLDGWGKYFRKEDSQ